jgi:hypothetical protein
MALKLDLSGYTLHASADRPYSPDAAGECVALDDGNYEINVDPRLNDHAFGETFIHELLEAIDMMYDLKMAHTQIQTLGVALNLLAGKGFGKEVRARLEKPKGRAKGRSKP